MYSFPEHAQIANLAFIENLYAKYLENPDSLESSWRHFFEGMDFGSYLYKRGEEPKIEESSARIAKLIHMYRTYGHFAAHCNPIAEPGKVPALELEAMGFFASELDQAFPSLGFSPQKKATLREIVGALQGVYCSRIGIECLEVERPDLRQWIREHIEPELKIELSIEEKHLLLESLNKSEILETFLHTKYPGVTRFSLEGEETSIPVLAEIIDRGAELGVEECMLAMAHRGRLNVLVNILNKPLEDLLEEFEDDTSLSFFGSDDVKYHMGFEGEWVNRRGKKVSLSIAANPSHLESVNPVLIGQVYAKQVLKKGGDKRKIVPITIHGDASIAGQGVVYETLQMMNLKNYSVGGTIHIVINNQIGYTTLPQEGRSTHYATDIAKAFGCPVFHVNTEDPESCIFVAKLAIEIRQKFQTDVFIDLLGYRKYGHNEGDEPSYTQPLEYKKIKEKKSIRQIYVEALLKQGIVEQKLQEALEVQFKDQLQGALAKAKKNMEKKSVPEAHVHPNLFEPVLTEVSREKLQAVLQAFATIPKEFYVHPKLKKWIENRGAALGGDIDWATGECLAFGTLLEEGVAIRLAGQDAQRGTFSQRHMIWTDVETGKTYSPLGGLKGKLEVVNSFLSEFAGLGFEVGYSSSFPQGLTLWEAQYGDFSNGGQIIIDQYLVVAEQKWKMPSGLVLLLPHGYEGSGSEHSSARPERYLQLAAGMNIQVVNATTPAQYFHLLRRQALRAFQKPLVLFTPKSLLRSSLFTSKIEAFTRGGFCELLDDPTPPKCCRRLILCTGKIFYDLLRARKENSDCSILRIEQLYPLHIEKLKELLAKYEGFTECLWVQEEPENMGAYPFLRPVIEPLVSKLHYVGRESNASTATGSSRKHMIEQAALIVKALGTT